MLDVDHRERDAHGREVQERRQRPGGAPGLRQQRVGARDGGVLAEQARRPGARRPGGDHGEGGGGRELHRGVAGRDAGAAAAGPPAQEQPRDDGHVVAGRDRGTAAGDRLGGWTTDSPASTRAMTTLRKLPTSRPSTAQTAMSTDRTVAGSVLRVSGRTTRGAADRPPPAQ